jgi:hypothetical protein
MRVRLHPLHKNAMWRITTAHKNAMWRITTAHTFSGESSGRHCGRTADSRASAGASQDRPHQHVLRCFSHLDRMIELVLQDCYALAKNHKDKSKFCGAANKWKGAPMSSFIRIRNYLGDRLRAAGGPRLLVATFNDLFWYFPGTGRSRLVHRSAGRYYGTAAVAPGLRYLLAVSRPDQDRDDVLLHLEQGSGLVRGRFQLASRDTHQIIRHGNELLVTDSYRGRVVAYSLPGLNLVRIYGGFSFADHVNSIRVLQGDLYVLCHNFGKSWLAKINADSGTVVDRYDEVGHESHEIVPWQDSFLVCDSRNGGLIRVNQRTKQATTLWSEAGQYTKGLAVENGIAYFGISPPTERESRYQIQCDLVAFDLLADRMLWRRRMPCAGLINAITSPAALEEERRGSTLGISGRAA